MSVYSGLLVTTIPGIEDVTAEEVRELIGATEIKERPFGLRGKVLVLDGKAASKADALIKRGRSVERVIALLGVFKVSRERRGLEEIYRRCTELPFEELITPFSRIAVRAQREGTHEYTSPEIARTVGKAILDRVRSVYGVRPPVDLDSPTVIVHAEVVGEHFLIGVDMTKGCALHERGYRRFVHPASLRPTIAFAMVRISGARDGEVILDPMCGGGTILIEAGLSLPRAKLLGMDINPQFVRGARMNAEAAGVASRLLLKVGDAHRLAEEFPGGDIDRVITNPPYGIRMKPPELRSLYEDFLEGAAKVLRGGGTVTMITIHRALTMRISRRCGLEPVHERTIYQGGIESHIIVLQKP